MTKKTPKVPSPFSWGEPSKKPDQRAETERLFLEFPSNTNQALWTLIDFHRQHLEMIQDALEVAFNEYAANPIAAETQLREAEASKRIKSLQLYAWECLAVLEDPTFVKACPDQSTRAQMVLAGALQKVSDAIQEATAAQKSE